MKFTKEDGVITAKEATNRCKNGKDDSVVREQIRTIMVRIKLLSGYGINIIKEQTSTIYQKLQNETIKELEKLGYIVKQEQQKDTVCYHILGPVYEYTVTWPKGD